MFKHDTLILEKLVREVLGMSDMAVNGGGRSEYEEARKAWEEREPARKEKPKDKFTTKIETEKKNSTHKEAKTDKKGKCEGNDVKRKSSKGSEILKNEEADGKQKKENVKEKKDYHKSESKKHKSGDVFGKKIGLKEMVRVYLDLYKKVVKRLGVAKVKEIFEEWDARRNSAKVEAKRKRQEVERSQMRAEEQEPPVKRNRSSGPQDNFRPGPAPGTRRSWCSECDKYLAGDLWKLQRHKDTVHLGLRPWECDGCNSKFGTKSHLEAHISQVHLGQRLYSCIVEGCGKSFRDNAHLKDHGRAEHNHPRHCCPDCGATYAWTTQFAEHRRKHRDISRV